MHMFSKLFTNLRHALYRSRKPLSPEEQQASEDRVWQGLATRLNNQSMTQNVTTAKSGRNSLSFLLPALAFVLVLGVVATMVYRPQQNKEKNQVASNDVTSVKVNPDIVNDVGVVARKQGATSNGVVGYVPKPKKAAQASLFASTAYAAEDEYTPVLFYTKSNAGTQSQLFSYDITSGTEKALTSADDYATTPVFSSKGQKLAYNILTGPNSSMFRPCQIAIQDHTTGKVIATIQKDDTRCLIPVSWSADGNYLVITDDFKGRPLDISEDSIIPKTDTHVRVYNVATNVLSDYVEPTNQGDCFSSGGWKDDVNFYIHCSTYGVKVGSEKRSVFSINVDTKVATEFTAPTQSFYGFQRVGNDDFYMASIPPKNPKPNSSYSPYRIVRRSATDTEPFVYPFSQMTSNFMVSKTSNGSAGYVVAGQTTADWFADEDPDAKTSPSWLAKGGVVMFDVKTGKPTHFNTAKGYVELVGWYGDYTHIIYVNSEDSGARQYRLLNLQDGKDSLIKSVE